MNTGRLTDWMQIMKKTEEIRLIKDCLALEKAKTTQLYERESVSPVERYQNIDGRFEHEMEAIFRRLPVPYAHSSQLQGNGTFITIDTPLGSLLFSRDDEGKVRAFHNVCRHRGTQLVNEKEGSAKRFRCPYHAWTYTAKGELSSVPHGGQCFPSLDKSERGLKELSCIERYGFLWVSPAESDQALVENHLQGLGEDLQWLGMDKLEIFATTKRVWKANWKLIADGGLESYHFRFAHKDSIADYFYDNLSIVEQFGPHARSVLPRKSIEGLADKAVDEWNIREHTHLTYALLPMTTFLVQHHHVEWIKAIPISPEETEVSIITLSPRQTNPMSDKDKSLWQLNHDITVKTLDEDFLLAESIQKGIRSGANKEFLFGRSEGALHMLHESIENMLESK